MTLATQAVYVCNPNSTARSVPDQSTLDDPSNLLDNYYWVNKRNAADCPRASSGACTECNCAGNDVGYVTEHRVFTRNSLRVGGLLAGKFRIERVIGSGGMGLILAAHHVPLDQRVAIKVLRPNALRHREAIERFLGEARTAAKIDNPHIVRVLDANAFDCGLTFLVMEYLEGADLADWVARKGPMPVAQAVEFVLQACEAIAMAHAMGIVHRDIKPSNLFCCRQADGSACIKVIDFGISTMSQPLDSDSGTLPSDFSPVIGSPHYMSPEQLRSPATVDGRTDIWSLGVTLFQLITGQLPFDGAAFPELAVTVATQPMPLLRNYRADIPPGLQRVIQHCLRKDPAQRCANITELADSLRPFATVQARAHIERIHATAVRTPLVETRRALLAYRPRRLGIWQRVKAWGQFLVRCLCSRKWARWCMPLLLATLGIEMDLLSGPPPTL
jgi:serine/threonine-protein kinase